MKKLLLSLGAIASMAAPVAAVVACGSTPDATPTATLANLKKIDIAEARQIAKTHSDVDEDALNGLIDKINAAKTVADLTNLMAGITHEPNNGGPIDNSGNAGTSLGQNVTSDSIEQVLKTNGYKIHDGSHETENIFDKLLENTKEKSNVNFHFGVATSGAVLDHTQKSLAYDTHNGDDFLIVIKGGTIIIDDTTATDATKAAELDATDTKFIGQWGTIKADEFDGATSIIYLHHTGTKPEDASISIVKVIKGADGKLYEVSGKDQATKYSALYTNPATA